MQPHPCLHAFDFLGPFPQRPLIHGGHAHGAYKNPTPIVSCLKHPNYIVHTYLFHLKLCVAIIFTNNIIYTYTA